MAEYSPIVIVVEDEPQIRRLLKTILSAQGYTTFEAAEPLFFTPP